MSTEHVVTFPHRRNADGSYDSICPECFLTAARAKSEEELTTLEKKHVCDSSFLADRGAFLGKAS
jgi:hypothetical protein